MANKTKKDEEITEPVEATEEEQAASGVDDIAADLSAVESDDVEAMDQSGVMTPAQSFDFTNLTDAQLQGLKQALDGASARVSKIPKKNPTVTLREYQGRLVTWIGKSFIRLVDVPEERRQRERTHLPIKFAGDKAETVVLYSDFMSMASRVTCEVVSQRSQENEKVIGEVFSKEQKRTVPMTVNYVKKWFTIKLPDGSTEEVDTEQCNA